MTLSLKLSFFPKKVRKKLLTQAYGKGRLKRWYWVEEVRWGCYGRVQGGRAIRAMNGGGGWVVEEGEKG